MPMAGLAQAERLCLFNARIGSHFPLQQLYVAYLQGRGFPHDREQLSRLLCVMALALQVRHSGLLRREPAFAFGHKVSGPRQLFPDDQLGMGIRFSQWMS